VFERVGGIGVEKSAAIGAKHLDRDLRGDRANSDGLLGAFERGRVDIRAKRLRDALPDQKERIGDADREQDVKRAAGDIDPEAADGTYRMTRKTTNKRNRQHNAGRGREIILVRQAEHLHQIAQRALAAVVLPVRIGDETDRGVERQILGYGGLFRRIKRQKRLQPHQRVDDEQAAKMKNQHADRISHRVLLLAFVDPGNLVDRGLNGVQDGREESAVTAEYARHIGAEQRRDRDYDRPVQQNLKPADRGHGLYPFRTALA